jgi:ATP-dependent helicase/DNAse subunit B
MHRGSLIHQILWQFLSDAVRRKSLPLAESHWPQLEAVAQARFDEFERRGVTGYPLMWRIEKARILRELREFLRLESAEPGPFRPAFFEVRFGMPPRDPEESDLSTNEPALLDLEGEQPVRFCGKMDRLDVDAAAKRCRVLDYKTGSNYLKLRDGSFHGGQALQLPIYLLGARRVLPQFDPDCAEYYYTSERGKWQRVRFTAKDLEEKKADLQFIVSTILNGIRAGRFFPLPEEADCEHCEFRLACGHGRFLEFKWKADPRTTAEFRKMAEIE